MEPLFPEGWASIHFGLILSITVAQMLVVYVLSDASDPPAGLGMYTVYFMASLLAWVAYTLQQGSSTPMELDVPSVAAIISSYILFLAAGQRVGVGEGRLLLGILCLLASLSAFFVPQGRMFLIQGAAMSLFFAGTGLLSGWRAWRRRNVGDAVIVVASLVQVTGAASAAVRYLAHGELGPAQTVILATYGTAHALVLIGFLASVLIEYQQQLSHLATEDPLTRLLNLRGLEDALRVSLASASRRDTPTAAITVDIDHFKQVNDSFGHELGDRVLQRVARILQQQSRGSDVLARTGGEEFLLVLPETELADARAVAERIRATIGERPLQVDEQDIPLTVSLGVACDRGEIDLDDLCRQADRAIYMAKRGGHNRVASVERNPVHLSTSGSEG